MKKTLSFKFLVFVSILSLSSCVNGDVTEKVDFTYSLCDGNSKVWMVNSIYKGESHLESRNELTANVFVFYSSGEFIYGDLSGIYNGEYEKGTYELISETSYLKLNFENKNWTYLFEFNDENNLILRPEENSESDLTYELIPFPVPI
jgi:hypothetical protein